jgi:hypothetical protein
MRTDLMTPTGRSKNSLRKVFKCGTAQSARVDRVNLLGVEAAKVLRRSPDPVQPEVAQRGAGPQLQVVAGSFRSQPQKVVLHSSVTGFRAP